MSNFYEREDSELVVQAEFAVCFDNSRGVNAILSDLEEDIEEDAEQRRNSALRNQRKSSGARFPTLE